jgi:hypothetical protein
VSTFFHSTVEPLLASSSKLKESSSSTLVVSKHHKVARVPSSIPHPPYMYNLLSMKREFLLLFVMNEGRMIGSSLRTFHAHTKLIPILIFRWVCLSGCPWHRCEHLVPTGSIFTFLAGEIEGIALNLEFYVRLHLRASVHVRSTELVLKCTHFILTY